MLFLVHVVCALTGRLICPLTFPKRTLEMVGTIPIMWVLILPIYMCMEGAHSSFMPPFLHFLRSVIVPAVSVVLQMASVVDLIATVATIGPLGQVALVYVSPQTIQQGEALAISCVRKKIMEFIISISYKWDISIQGF